MLTTIPVTDAIIAFLKMVPILPRRLYLEQVGPYATVSQLRGAWGAALHDLEPVAYQTVFAPQSPEAVPGYLLRLAQAHSPGPFALDWFLFGDAMIHDGALCRAWDVASRRGLGSNRRPFHVRRLLPLGPGSQAAPSPGPWSLAEASGPVTGDAAETPCRLRFTTPLRLLRHGQLIEQPTLADLTVAACRRVRAFLPLDSQSAWNALRDELLDEARHQPSVWHGHRHDLHRYSASQQADLGLRGVTGVMDLPQGPGPLWPLLAASAWLHLGKGTVFGLGRFEAQAWAGCGR